MEAIRILDHIGDILGLASVYYDLGDLKAIQGQKELAAVFYRKSGENYERLGSRVQNHRP
jgi:hypothetical protein